MTDRATLLALADRVEAASGPDFALGVEVLRAVGRTGIEVNPLFSIDAAMEIVPEGAGVEVHRYWTAADEDAVWSASVIWGMGSTEQSLDLPSAPLALTAAALRALAQEAPSDE